MYCLRSTTCANFQAAHAPGSKIKVTSIIHMAWELAALLLAYQVLGIWTVLADGQVAKAAS